MSVRQRLFVFLYFSDFLSWALCMGCQIDEDVLFISLCFVYLHVSPRVAVRCALRATVPLGISTQLRSEWFNFSRTTLLLLLLLLLFLLLLLLLLTAAVLDPQHLLVRKTETNRILSEHQIRQTVGLMSTRSRRVGGPEVQNAKCSTGMNCHFPSTWTTCPSDDSTQRINSASLTLSNSKQRNLWFGSTTWDYLNKTSSLFVWRGVP